MHSGPNKTFDSMLQLRQEEAFEHLRKLIDERKDPSVDLFSSHESAEFNPIKLMFKESDEYKAIPAEKLLFVSTLIVPFSHTSAPATSTHLLNCQ